MYKKVDALQGIELGIDDSIVEKLIHEIELLLITLKMTSYNTMFEEQITKDHFSLVGIQATKNKTHINFDLICSCNDLTITNCGFMFSGINKEQIDEMFETISEVIKKDVGHTNDFQIVKQHDMFYVRTIEDTDPKLIPYLIDKMRAYV